METKPHNYGRFYGLLKQMPGMNLTDLKSNLILQCTNGRTQSLHEMTAQEYDAMCRSMENAVQDKTKLRWQRSICLKLMQQIDVDTTKWTEVDRFCENPRIAGKRFSRLSYDELEKLEKKLRAIKAKMKNDMLINPLN
jgi:hypothetical protein